MLQQKEASVAQLGLLSTVVSNCSDSRSGVVLRAAMQ